MACNKGDIVVITKSSDNWNEKMDKFVGQILKYNGNNSHPRFEDMPADMDRWGWVESQRHFRLATDYEKIAYYSKRPKPKVGDRVILKEDMYWNETMRESMRDKIVIVDRLTDQGFKIKGSEWTYTGYELAGAILDSVQITVALKEGDSYFLRGNSGTILFEEDYYYWDGNGDELLEILYSLNVRPKKFCEKFLGYYNKTEYSVKCKSLQDLVYLLEKISSYKEGSDSTVEFETQWSTYAIDGKIAIAGQVGKIMKDSSGDFPYYVTDLTEDIDFDTIAEITSFDKYAFQESILGYSDPEEYDFPQCESIRDLVKFCEAITQALKPKTITGIPPREELKSDNIVINGFEARSVQNSQGFFWAHPAACETTIFKGWYDKKRSFQYQVLGYEDIGRGDFPYCRTYEDLLKFCSAIHHHNLRLIEEERLLKTPYGPQDPIPTVSRSTPDIPIILINVPKI